MHEAPVARRVLLQADPSGRRLATTAEGMHIASRAGVGLPEPFLVDGDGKRVLDSPLESGTWVTPYMEVERIFNVLRWKYLRALAKSATLREAPGKAV